MPRTSATNSNERRRRLSDAELTPEQHAAVLKRRAERKTVEYQQDLTSDIDAYRREYPPAEDPDFLRSMAALRHERERQGLSLSDMSERTGIDRATISKLETGKIANPTIGTLTTYARALGQRLAWRLEAIAENKIT